MSLQFSEANPASYEAFSRGPHPSFNASRIMACSLAEKCTGTERLALARGFGYRLTAAWWRALTRSDPLSAPLRSPLEETELADLSGTVQILADSLGETLAQLDAVDAAYELGLIYTGMLPPDHRAKHGIYYTPPDLTARLIAQSTNAGVDWTNCRVLDPACGGGAFLAPIARRIVEALPNCAPRILVQNIATRLRGYEIDPFAAWLSQVTLDAVILPITRIARCTLPVVVTICDSLSLSIPNERFNLVIGNPPYGRIRLKPEDRSRFRRSLYGHANLYGLFTDMALTHTRSGGIVAYVTPTGFLAGGYFKNLRALLGSEAPPVTIDFVSLRKGVFDGVLQETLLATYRRGGSQKRLDVCKITPSNRGGVVVENAGKFPLPDDRSQPWLLPRHESQGKIVNTLMGMKHRLADWGYCVSTGPLVWNRHKTQLSHQPGPKRYPLIWAEAVTSDGHFVWRARKKNHAPYFDVGPGDDWLVTHTPCVLLQRTTAKEQRRRLIATPLPSEFLARHGAVVVENHLNMLRPITKELAVPCDVLAVFLNSTAADHAFRCVSGSVAVSAYELESFPLPAPEELNELIGLVRTGAGPVRIETACARLYAGAA